MLECDWTSAGIVLAISLCSSLLIGIPAYFVHKEQQLKSRRAKSKKISSKILYNNSEWGPEVIEDGEQKRD